MAVVVKRGVFGGTFDPVHLGHLLIAEYVRRKLALDEVIILFWRGTPGLKLTAQYQRQLIGWLWYPWLLQGSLILACQL